MATRRKPFDPAKAAVAAIERRQRDEEAARLESQGAVVRRDRGGQIISAWRSNCFNLLLERGCINASQHDAAYRLSLDWAAWKRLDGAPDGSVERVDGPATTSKSLVTDRMLKAGARVAGAMRELDLAQRLVIEALMVATVEEDRPMEWRGIVQRVTGNRNKTAQRDLVVSAIEALREYYEAPRTQDRVAA